MEREQVRNDIESLCEKLKTVGGSLVSLTYSNLWTSPNTSYQNFPLSKQEYLPKERSQASHRYIRWVVGWITEYACLTCEGLREKSYFHSKMHIMSGWIDLKVGSECAANKERDGEKLRPVQFSTCNLYEQYATPVSKTIQGDDRIDA